ncbi:MAG: hypothetical protein K6T87_03505 [Roseiflexus sp.]|uniref:hypothetical protein n=1 Tax=Roseiflexus sp. TaxID=2562120 RepID=UPI0025E4678F|nr:hypothetical protein [Roseiflexus sp.]MCL6539650.1 hypothetical protein [Roseiflexus sp.]
MNAYRVETTAPPDGSLAIRHLLLQAGESVEVIMFGSPATDGNHPPLSVTWRPNHLSRPNRTHRSVRLGSHAMIIFDTHTRLWRVHDDPQLPPNRASPATALY